MGNRPFDIAPAATLDRPLSVVSVRDLRFVRILQVATAALRDAAKLARVKGVDVRSDVREFTVTGHGPFPYQVDGDFMGPTEQLSFRYAPDALRLVMP